MSAMLFLCNYASQILLPNQSVYCCLHDLPSFLMSQHYLKLSQNLLWSRFSTFLNKNVLLVRFEVLFIWLMAGQCRWTLSKLTLIYFLNLCVMEASGPKPKILVDCNAAIPSSLYLSYSFEDKGS